MYTLPQGIELTDSRAGSEGRGAGRATRGGAGETAGVVRRTTGVRLMGVGSERRAVSRRGSGGGGSTARGAGAAAGGSRAAIPAVSTPRRSGAGEGTDTAAGMLAS